MKKQDRHECPNCGVVCTRASSLKRYVYLFVPLSVRLPVPSVCPLGPPSVRTAVNCSPCLSPDLAIEKQDRHECPNCGVVCTRASSLKRYVCPLVRLSVSPNCGFVCTRASSLKRYVCPPVPLPVRLGLPVCTLVSKKAGPARVSKLWCCLYKSEFTEKVCLFNSRLSVHSSACLSTGSALCLFPGLSKEAGPARMSKLWGSLYTCELTQKVCLSVCSSSCPASCPPVCPPVCPLDFPPVYKKQDRYECLNCGVVCTHASSLKR